VSHPPVPLNDQSTNTPSAWDNPQFRAAIEATGKKQIIVAGITTDVCTAFLSRSLRAAGYTVFANVEASGTTTELVRDTANAQMAMAGVQLYSLFAIVCDLMRDWRNTCQRMEILRDITQLRFRLVRLFQERLGSSRAGMDQLSFRKVEKKKHQVK
jgi:hypothetical protein